MSNALAYFAKVLIILAQRFYQIWTPEDKMNRDKRERLNHAKHIDSGAAFYLSILITYCTTITFYL
jgi:hypothetical protein